MYRKKFGASSTPTTPPPKKFTASMRGWKIPEPLPQRGLTPEERADPRNVCVGPSLLTRDLHGDKTRPGVQTRRGHEVKLVVPLPNGSEAAGLRSAQPTSPSKASMHPR